MGKENRSRLLHADEHLAAVDKPAGLPSQATLTSDRGTLPDLAARLVGGAGGVVHRLDRETSGVVVLARTREAASALAEAFRRGEPEKTYLALCARAPEPPAKASASVTADDFRGLRTFQEVAGKRFARRAAPRRPRDPSVRPQAVGRADLEPVGVGVHATHR